MTPCKTQENGKSSVERERFCAVWKDRKATVPWFGINRHGYGILRGFQNPSPPRCRGFSPIPTCGYLPCPRFTLLTDQYFFLYQYHNYIQSISFICNTFIVTQGTKKDSNTSNISYYLLIVSLWIRRQLFSSRSKVSKFIANESKQWLQFSADRQLFILNGWSICPTDAFELREPMCLNLWHLTSKYILLLSATFKN